MLYSLQSVFRRVHIIHNSRITHTSAARNAYVLIVQRPGPQKRWILCKFALKLEFLSVFGALASDTSMELTKPDSP